MELDNLKSNWKSAGTNKKGQKELWTMTKIKNHPQIKRIRTKFLIEAILLIVFTLVYYNGFDGHTKPLWANVFLVCSTTLYFTIRSVGWLALQNPIKGKDIRKSLLNFHRNLKVIAVAVLLSSMLFGISVISFFTSVIDFTKEKYAILGIMIISLLVLVYLSSRNWIKRVVLINDTLSDFSNTEN